MCVCVFVVASNINFQNVQYHLSNGRSACVFVSVYGIHHFYVNPYCKKN